MKTLKAIIQYIKMSEVFKGAVRQTIETFYQESLKGYKTKDFPKKH